MKRLLAGVMAAAILSFGGVNVYAAEHMANGVQTEVTAQQDTYGENDTAKVKVTVTNYSGKEISGLKIEQMAGEGVEFVNLETVLAQNESLADNDGREYYIEVKRNVSGQSENGNPNAQNHTDDGQIAQNPTDVAKNEQNTGTQADTIVSQNKNSGTQKAAQTGDHADKKVVFVMSGLMLTAGLYTIVRRKKTKEMFALLLCGAIISQSIPVTVRADGNLNDNADDSINYEMRTLEYEVTENVHFGENDYEVTVKITFDEQVETIENYIPQSFSGKNFPENIVVKAPLIDTQKNNHFVFIGNSLLGIGKSHLAFKTIAENYGKQVDTDGLYFYGKTLREAKDAIDDEETYGYQDDVNDADVIVFQEYGMAYETTVEDIKAFMQDYKNDNTVYYYYTSQYDQDMEGLEEFEEEEELQHLFYLKKLEAMGVHVMSTNKLIEALQEEFEEKQGVNHLIISSDYIHPTIFLGYCTSLYMFSKMYKVSARNVALSSMGEQFYELLPGETDEKKMENYHKITDMIDEIGK